MSQPVIKAENVGKLYKLGQIGTGTLANDLKRWWAKNLHHEDPFSKINGNVPAKQGDFWALNKVSFTVQQGEVLGIIGRNGAGKSTLLKILSKITSPTTGLIKIKGRIGSLLEVGTGFHPEMTGRENIFLNGAILGMSRREINHKLAEIIDFSGVEKYIDTPVKRYSSGMYVRLAFAVAAHLEPEILIIDEVLAVGDAEFQQKCLGKMKEVSHNHGRTILFVSHDLNAISQLCTRGILLSSGSISFEGHVNQVISTYLSNHNREAYYIRPAGVLKSMYILEVSVLNQKGRLAKEFFYNQPITIKFKIAINNYIAGASLFVTILDSRKRRIFSCEKETVEEEMNLVILPETLVRGRYSVMAFINQPKIEQLDAVEDICDFTILDNGSYLAKHGGYDYGSVFGRYFWQ